MIPLLINILSFLLLLLTGSLVQCGWYKVTRKGMLCGFWSEYFEKLTPDAMYVEKEIKDLELYSEHAAKYNVQEWLQSFLEDMKQKQKRRDAYKEADIWYTKPAWLVYPISGCIYCFSSIYGSLFFWIGGFVFFKTAGLTLHLTYHLFILWIVFVLCSSALNGILIKKVL